MHDISQNAGMCVRPQKDGNGEDGDKTFRKSLRNAVINHRNGWLFVTCQVAQNRSSFTAIVDEQCVLTSSGGKSRRMDVNSPRNTMFAD